MVDMLAPFPMVGTEALGPAAVSAVSAEGLEMLLNK